MMLSAIVLCLCGIVFGCHAGVAIRYINTSKYITTTTTSNINVETTIAIGEILSELRQLMETEEMLGTKPIQAYIIPSIDAHQSEYVSRRDRRMSYVSGFTGSSGTAIVTKHLSALWTDSRYYLQAESQMDNKYWTLMKSGLPETPTQREWLNEVLPNNSRIGIDPFLITHTEFASLSENLESNGHTLVAITPNLIDRIWTTRPALNLSSIVPLEIQFSGKSSSEKLTELRQDIKDQDAESHVVIALDEIAWLFNLRGLDIEYNPVFFAYAIISMDSVELYALNHTRITSNIYAHFEQEGIDVIVREYDLISSGINEMLNSIDGMMLLAKPNEAIYSAVPEHRRRIVNESPITLRKVIKNDIEAIGMRNAHIRDGLALTTYLWWLEQNVDNGNVTELSGAKRLMEFRSEQDNFRGLSFTAISASGPHAAMAHYSPTDETDRLITRNEIYLIDSGGQYWDGTTDVTRTVHMGVPSDAEIDAFTRVLKGFISLNGAVFPPGAPFSFFDALARKALWDVGLNYGHGTGHGVGAYLCVHEYPPLISSTNTYPGMEENMFTSNEPAYYKDGEFGIRIEDVIQVIPGNVTVGDFDGEGVLQFYDITMVPIQQKLINVDLLTKTEINWLNAFHQRIQQTLLPLLRNPNAEKWLIEQTKPIVNPCRC